MNKNPVLRCTDLGTMDNLYTSPKRSQPEPPEGFVDNTVKVFRLNPDGSKGEIVRTMPAFPEGWEDPARRRLTPGSGARNQKEDEEMARPRREPPPVETLRALYEKYDAKIQPIAIELDATWMMARRWLREAGIIEAQTPTPEPTQAANQEPEREKEETATQSVAQEEPETYDEICPSQDTTLDEMKLIWIEDVMEHCVTVETKMRYIQAIAELRV